MHLHQGTGRRASAPAKKKCPAVGARERMRTAAKRSQHAARAASGGNPPCVQASSCSFQPARAASAPHCAQRVPGEPLARACARARCAPKVPESKTKKCGWRGAPPRGPRGPRGAAWPGAHGRALRRVALGEVADSAVSLARSLVLKAAPARAARARIAACGDGGCAAGPLRTAWRGPACPWPGGPPCVQPRAPPPPSFTASPLSRAQRPVGAPVAWSFA